MSPEHLSGHESMDRRADIYSAGVILWEMLTGRRLFTGDDPGALMARVMAGPTQSPGQVASDIPPAVDYACMNALRSLEERFPSALAFAEALEEAAEVSGLRVASARQVGAFAREAATVSPENHPAHTPTREGTPSHSRPVIVLPAAGTAASSGSLPAFASVPAIASVPPHQLEPVIIAQGQETTSPSSSQRKHRFALPLAGLLLATAALAGYIVLRPVQTSQPPVPVASDPAVQATGDPGATATASQPASSAAASDVGSAAASSIPVEMLSAAPPLATDAPSSHAKPQKVVPVYVPPRPPPPPPAPTATGNGRFHPLNP
jgi:serine/threonine-protein kinase